MSQADVIELTKDEYETFLEREVQEGVGLAMPEFIKLFALQAPLTMRTRRSRG
jgi:hypothetical protein